MNHEETLPDELAEELAEEPQAEHLCPACGWSPAVQRWYDALNERSLAASREGGVKLPATDRTALRDLGTVVLRARTCRDAEHLAPAPEEEAPSFALELSQRALAIQTAYRAEGIELTDTQAFWYALDPEVQELAPPVDVASETEPDDEPVGEPAAAGETPAPDEQPSDPVQDADPHPAA